MKDLSSITHQVISAVQDVGYFIQQESLKFAASDVEEKSLNSLVTYVDKTSEELLTQRLQKIIPTSGFITEEEVTQDEMKEFTWIIDPLDGTTNFIHRLPFYCISVALQIGGKTVLGVVYEMNHKEMYHAISGQGAFLNKKPIQVSKTKNLKDAIIATGFPYYDYSGLEAYLSTFEYFVKNTRGVRRFGSAAMDLAYVACGRFDGFFEYGLNVWDVAAGILLVHEAGGKLQDFTGGEQYLDGNRIIASNSYLAMRISNITGQYFSS